MGLISKIESNNCECYGVKEESGIRVLRGSRARRKMVASCKDQHRKEQQTIINGNYVEVTNEQLIFIKDYFFTSRALAESVLKGMSRDGRGWSENNYTDYYYNNTILPAIDKEINKSNNQILIPEEIDISKQTYQEGAIQKIYINSYERDPKARQACLDHWGYSCQVCNMSFEKQYGEHGKDYIHVHHRIPLSEIGKNYEINPIQDLYPVCPNCHAMLHRSKKVLQIEELRNLLNQCHAAK